MMNWTMVDITYSDGLINSHPAGIRQLCYTMAMVTTAAVAISPVTVNFQEIGKSSDVEILFPVEAGATTMGQQDQHYFQESGSYDSVHIALGKKASQSDLLREAAKLKIPHNVYRGNWIVILGREIVAYADSITELKKKIPGGFTGDMLIRRIPR